LAPASSRPPHPGTEMSPSPTGSGVTRGLDWDGGGRTPERDSLYYTEDGPHGLLLRVEVALQALAEGRTRAAGGAEDAAELRRRIAGLERHLNVDLREVQENVVEHAAMYANCPEVLGGMLQLVFCLDLLRQWLSERDARAKESEQRVEALASQFGECELRLGELVSEVKACGQRAKALELAEDLKRATPQRSVHEHRESGLSLASGGSPKTSDVSTKMFQVDLEALEDMDECLPLCTNAAADFDMVSLEDLRRENAELRARLEERPGFPVAEQQPTPVPPAPVQPVVLLSQTPVPVPVLPTAPAQSLLVSLEKLEPMLASLPVDAVPGMLELQEEACEAYGRLRSIVLEAAAAPDHQTGTVPGQSGDLRGAVPWTYRSSCGTSDVQGAADSPSTHALVAGAQAYSNVGVNQGGTHSVAGPPLVCGGPIGHGGGVVDFPTALPQLGVGGSTGGTFTLPGSAGTGGSSTVPSARIAVHPGVVMGRSHLW